MFERRCVLLLGVKNYDHMANLPGVSKDWRSCKPSTASMGSTSSEVMRTWT